MRGQGVRHLQASPGSHSLRVNPSLGDVALSWHLRNHQFQFFFTPSPPDDKSHFAFFERPIILFPDCHKDNQKCGCKRRSLFSFHSPSYLITMYGHDIHFKNDSFARQSVIQIHCETCTNRRTHFLSLFLSRPIMMDKLLLRDVHRDTDLPLGVTAITSPCASSLRLIIWPVLMSARTAGGIFAAGMYKMSSGLMSPNASGGCRCAVFRSPICMLRTAFSMPGITCVLCTSKIKNGEKCNAKKCFALHFYPFKAINITALCIYLIFAQREGQGPILRVHA